MGKHKNYWLVLGALVLGLCFSLIVYFTVHKWEKIDQQLAFQSQAQSVAHTIENELHDFTNALYSLGDFIKLSDTLTRDQFGQFSQNHLARYSSILSFSWNLMIPASEREAYSLLLASEGFEGVEIRQADANGKMVPDKERGFYFPVYFIEPLSRMIPILGFNVASHDLRAEALKLAFNKNMLTATERIDLVVQDEKITGLLLLLPIWDERNPEMIKKRGVLIEAINLNSLINHILPVNAQSIELSIIDNDAKEVNQLLYDSKNRSITDFNDDYHFSQPKKGLVLKQSIGFANRHFTILISPSEADLSTSILSLSWVAFVFSIVLTCSFCFYWIKRQHKTLEAVMNAEQHNIANKKLTAEIVERLNIEKQLVKFAHAFQLSADGINLLTMEGDYSYSNEASITLYGYSTEEIYDLNYFDINEDPALKELDLLNLIKRQGVWHGEFTQTRKDGTKFPASISLSLIKDESGSEIGILEITRDITETTLLEAELHQSRKMEALGTLAGGIAHDFNNILASILGNSEMILMSKIDPNKTKGYVANIQESCNRAADLVKQIMTFSRMETMAFDTINLSEIVNNALQIMRASMPANIQIVGNISNHCSPIKGDVTQIHQILLNLCANASQAIGDKGGTISIELHQETTTSHDNLNISKEQVKLSITDTGHGISSENNEKIFDPFFTTKKIGEGTGLGLAVVKSIIEEHDGEIAVKSDLGQGASFIVTFPTCEAPHNNNNKESEVVEVTKKPESTEKHVLIVEDEPHISRLYREFIKEYGYQTTVCSDGKQALDAYNDPNNYFDLVLTDQAMPSITGKELSLILLKKNPDLPIIMCTGYSEVISEELAIEMGIKHYFLKPASLTKLMEAIDNLLKD